MKLQLAIDLITADEAVKLVSEVKEYIDIVEIGTPVIINEGLNAVQKMKTAHPDIQVLADLKIMDAAGYEVSQATSYGADIVTILGAAEDASIQGAIKAAKEAGKEILVDMIAVKDLAGRAKELDAMGADYICVHTGYDLQAEGQTPLESLKIIKDNVKQSKTAVAGGITLDTLAEAASVHPDLIIMGGGIANHEQPKEAARQSKELIK